MYWKKDGGSSKSPFGEGMMKCAECGWALSKRIDVVEKGFMRDGRVHHVCSKRCLAKFILRYPGKAFKTFVRGHARAA